MSLISRIIELETKKYIFLLILFASSVFFRLPTLFNDYYDVDELSAIVQTHEYMAGDVPGRDFRESKLPLYHAVFKLSYKICPGNGWVIVHALTILIIFFTALFIYLSAGKIFDFGTGAVAGVLYAVLISSFNRHFMATNGEIIFNLPIAGGFYFFVLFLRNDRPQKYIPLALSIAFGIAAAFVKGQGSVFLLYLVFFILIYRPYYRGGFTIKYLLGLALIFSGLVVLTAIDYSVTGLVTSAFFPFIKLKLLDYAWVNGFHLIFFGKLLHRQGMLAIWHFVLWIPAFIHLGVFIKRKCKAITIDKSAVFILFALTYMMIFLGGSRFYFHYFIAVYPMLCIISSSAIIKLGTGKLKRICDNFTILLLIPSVFFFLWNTKDIIIKYIFPRAFYNEGKFLYWSRSVLVGTYNDYLLPDPSYKDVCEYITTITNPGDRIFVWGDGPYLYYFSGRRLGIRHVWVKPGVFRIYNLYNKGDNKSISIAEKAESNYIGSLKKKKPVLFIDTSENGLSTFYFKPTPLVERYVKNNYSFIKEINKMKIYKIK